MGTGPWNPGPEMFTLMKMTVSKTKWAKTSATELLLATHICPAEHPKCALSKHSIPNIPSQRTRYFILSFLLLSSSSSFPPILSVSLSVLFSSPPPPSKPSFLLVLEKQRYLSQHNSQQQGILGESMVTVHSHVWLAKLDYAAESKRIGTF